MKRHLLQTTLLSFTLSLAAAFATDTWLNQSYLWNNIGLQKAYNTGIAFSINLGTFQTPIILIALGLLAWVAFKQSKHVLEHIGYGLILGGGLANVVDRLLDGKVTDMFRAGSFPIFNVADSCINVGVALLIVHMISQKLQS